MKTEIIYNKLIRDKIPEIIKADGKTPVVWALDDDEFLNALNQKLCEEVNEYLNDEFLEELCDILEVVYAIANAKGYSLNDIKTQRNNKNLTNGAFEDRLFLEKVIEENENDDN